MVDVLINHAFVSGKPASSDPTKVDGPKWDAALVVSAGADGESIVRDSASTTGASFLQMIPAIPVTSYDDIPDGQVRMFWGGTPTKLALVYNNGGTFVEMSVTP